MSPRAPRPERASPPVRREPALRLELALLGDFHVRVAGVEAGGFESRKARAVLAYLALQDARPVGRERLAALFWPGLEPEGARRNLRQVLYNLRATLGDARRCLVVDAQEVRLATAAVAVDALRFEAAAREGLEGRGPASVTALGRALELYRGELLAGLALRDAEDYEAWREAERERLRELAMTVAREALRRSEADGLHEAALRFARRLGELDPLSEEACRAQMRLLARLGRRAQALAHYTGFAARLSKELEAEPGEEIRALRSAILADAALPGTDAERPGPTGPLVPLVGRERAWRELGAVWSEVREGASRITLVLGGRGTGKTRLVRSFLYQALAGGRGVVLLARCPRAQGDPLRSLLVEAAASLPSEAMERPRPELAQALAGAVAALPEVWQRRQDLPGAGHSAAADPTAAMATLLAELARRPRPSSRGVPVVLFVDDLERSPEVLGGLSELKRRIGPASVWIVAAARSDELAPPGLDELRSMLETGGGRAVEVGRLDLQDVRRAAQALVAESESEGLAAVLMAASDGLPLALAEAVNLLADQLVLREVRGGGWAVAEPEALARGLPAGPEGLIDRRIELLPKTSRRLLGLAAVIGERFDTATLLEVDREHPAVLELALQILIERWMVRPLLTSWTAHRRDRDLAIWNAGARHGPFEFAQRAVRDRLMATISPDRRRVLLEEISRAREGLERSRPGGAAPT